MSRRRKKHAAHANHERWLVSYADFITLLFAFFVVMFASSQVDQRKVGKLALAVQVAFQQMGIFQASSTTPALNADTAVPLQDAQLIENIQKTTSFERMVPAASNKTGVPGEVSLGQMRKELETALSAEIKKRDISVELSREGLVISLKEVGFFRSGSAELLPDARERLDRISDVLEPRPYQLRIEGHTDNVPIHTARFASNWELSTTRAIEIVQILITDHHFAPDRLSAGGYAEYHPVADNRTAEGRQNNRRVDIVVVPPTTGLSTNRHLSQN